MRIARLGAALAAVVAIGVPSAAPETGPSPQEVVTDGSPSDASPLVLLDPILVDGTGAPSRPVAAVVVEEGRIARIVERGAVSGPGRRVDAAGLYLIPGLWDLHVHLYWAREAALPLLLAHGVTGARDMGGDVDELLEWRRRLAAGQMIGPRLQIAGPLFVEKAGLTPLEALQSATRDAAEFLGLADRLGTVEVGKEADMVLLAADPLADIRNLAAVRGVVARGRLYDAAALGRLLDDVRENVRSDEIGRRADR